MCDIAALWARRGPRAQGPQARSAPARRWRGNHVARWLARRASGGLTGVFDRLQVFFACPIVRQLRSIHLVDEGFIKRIRGTAYSTRVSPQTSNRIVETSRGIFNKLLPDVYIYSDHYKGAESGQSPGFALSLVAETTTGVFLGAEAAATGGNLPEDVAEQASHLLCEEISKGGCVDTANQGLVLLYMALSPEDVSKVRFGKLTPYMYAFVYLFQLSTYPHGHLQFLSLPSTESSICATCVTSLISRSRSNPIQRPKLSCSRASASDTRTRRRRSHRHQERAANSTNVCCSACIQVLLLPILHA